MERLSPKRRFGFQSHDALDDPVGDPAKSVEKYARRRWVSGRTSIGGKIRSWRPDGIHQDGALEFGQQIGLGKIRIEGPTRCAFTSVVGNALTLPLPAQD